MNRTPETDHLLRDVLSEGTPPGYMEALLAGTLRLARRRRIYRRARNVSAGLALITACAFFGWKNLPKELLEAMPTKDSFVMVRTQPMDAGAIICTRPRDAGRIISSVSGAVIVRTSREISRVINDRELIALVLPRPAVLIRTGADAEQLEFVNAEDRKVIHVE
jgi:hypothetical protein